MHTSIALTQVKGQEPKLYETLGLNAGLFFTFTLVKIKGLNKLFELKKTVSIGLKQVIRMIPKACWNEPFVNISYTIGVI